MARYGSGGYNEWKDNRVTEYDKKTEGAAAGLKGWAGNQTVAYEAEKLAKQRGKGKDAAGKDSIYWKWAENDLIRKARKGGDPHADFTAHNMQNEINDLRDRLDSGGGQPKPKKEAPKKEKPPENYVASAERKEALAKVDEFEGQRDQDGGGGWIDGAEQGFNPHRKYTTESSGGSDWLNAYSADLKSKIKKHRQTG